MIDERIPKAQSGVIGYTHYKSDKHVSMGSEFEVGGYKIEIKGGGEPHHDSMIIGGSRDLSAAIFVNLVTVDPDYTVGDWDLCAWWTRAEVESRPADRMFKGSLCRFVPSSAATREFIDLARLLRKECGVPEVVAPKAVTADDYRRAKGI